MHFEVLLQEIMICHFMNLGMKYQIIKGGFTESVQRYVHAFAVPCSFCP